MGAFSSIRFRERDLCVPLLVTAESVGDDLDQFDLRFADGRDEAMILSEMIADGDAMDDAVGADGKQYDLKLDAEYNIIERDED